MAGREELHDLRRRAHEARIEGASRMDERQLRQALQEVGRGVQPMTAKREAKGQQ
ncbi:hypothetical protein SAMN05444365_102196 [Micromonospora pattaloongensis]|uniref:Uncharacterized protein n=1 Tax=Micromonospora pattaloongensis TaxID=405436 RepID=A0A1H3JNU3_9ACTN|nr:hypothetical protein [Micromonospora pattaloongensis]SDY41603.1 hypothetical protein SAMN05444365_102196 [Micromonospora pattaloongensis]